MAFPVKEILRSAQRFALILLFTPLLSLPILAAENVAFTAEYTDFSMSPQPLYDALESFSAHVGVNLILKKHNKLYQSLNKYYSHPLIGPYTPERALEIILADTPFVFHYELKTNRLLLENSPAKPALSTLDTATQPIEETNVKLPEEVLVRGYPFSFRDQMSAGLEVKRDGWGVIDSISAFKIGEFPDTDLLDALKRVSGVSVDRSAGIARWITVRGFGPDFNLVTLNGRQMPTALFESTDEQAPATRSFDFSNLATEQVARLDIFKTGRADNPSGSIGSTIDIRTHRPLDSPGQQFTLSGNSVANSLNKYQTSPDTSGLYSNTWLDDRLGFLISGSYREAERRTERVLIDGWVDNLDLGDNPLELNDNNQNIDGDYWLPRNLRYSQSLRSQKRINVNTSLQFAPTEQFKVTLDYLHTELDNREQRDEFAIWFQYYNTLDHLTIDENGSGLFFTQNGNDFTFSEHRQGDLNKNRSRGLNFQWQASSNLTLDLDIHNATATSSSSQNRPGELIIMGIPRVGSKTFDIRHTEIPIIDLTLESGLDEIQASELDMLWGRARDGGMKTEITQWEFSGRWQGFNKISLAQIDFGLGLTQMDTRSNFASSVIRPAPWPYGGNQELFDDALFPSRSTAGWLSEFSGNEGLLNNHFDIDTRQLIDISTPLFGWGEFKPNEQARSLHRVDEDTHSAFLQMHFKQAFFGQPLNIVTGLRYEKTKVQSDSFINRPISAQWSTANGWELLVAENKSFEGNASSYDAWLPNFDIDLELPYDLKLRLSATKTITRSDLSKLSGLNFTLEGQRAEIFSATRGNPNLKPYTSNNIDLSLEWYFTKHSYLSLGYYYKRVNNFITTQAVTPSDSDGFFAVTDPLNGPRADAARQSLLVEQPGVPITEQLIIENIATPIPDTENSILLGSNEDALASWTITQPINNGGSLTLNGIELAFQHQFENTDFGVASNITLTGGGTDYDLRKTGEQFVLPGRSDTANFIGYYDNGKLSVKLGYNWRDQFLSNTHVDITGDQPVFTESRQDIDIKITYHVNNQLTTYIEGLNLNGSTQRDFSRYKSQLISAQSFGKTLRAGFRYTL
ncbi:MAG: hypothetical protein COA42_09035 [Alteromonadaceae bacterium]|nr:MAG: hypothetical protein COA42_09035 [Alteromonadaceae bacterium]